MIIPLNAIDERKYHAHRNNPFSLPKQTCSVSNACAAEQVNWNMSPGITFSGIGEIATVVFPMAGGPDTTMDFDNYPRSI